MTTIQLPAQHVSVLERIALAVGGALLHWADRHAARALRTDAGAPYRERCSDTARTRSALVRQGMLP